MAYRDPSTQQTTPFKAPKDKKVPKFEEFDIESIDGDPTESTKAGKSAALPREAGRGNFKNPK